MARDPEELHPAYGAPCGRVSGGRGLMEPLPFACSLSSADLEDRSQAWLRLVNGWAVARRPIEGGVQVDFRPAPGLVESLRDLIALESECCPWMDIHLNQEQGIRLCVTGPEGTANELRRLFGVSS